MATEAQRERKREYMRRYREERPEETRRKARESMARWKAQHPEHKSTENVRKHREKIGLEAVRERARLDAQKRRARLPHLSLKGNYGLSHDRARFLYEQMKTATCQICSGPKVVFDHNHATGEFRGFLCSACNSGIGQFQDNPALLQAAIDYLRKDANRS